MPFCGGSDGTKVVIISEKREGNGRNKVIFLSDYIDIIIEKSPKKHQNTEKAKTNSIRLKLFFNFVAETS